MINYTLWLAARPTNPRGEEREDASIAAWEFQWYRSSSTRPCPYVFLVRAQTGQVLITELFQFLSPQPDCFEMICGGSETARIAPERQGALAYRTLYAG